MGSRQKAEGNLLRSAFCLLFFGWRTVTAKLRLAGHLKDLASGRDEVEVEAGRSVRDVLTELGIPVEVAALVVVNEEQQTKDYILKDGDQVRVLAVIGGG